MSRFSRSFLALAVAGALCGGVGCAQPAPVVQVSEAHPHMHDALAHLRASKRELEHAEEIFRGHRDEAIEHVDRAIHQVEDGLREQGDTVASSAEAPLAHDFEDARFPRLRRALAHLREARNDLEAAEPIFGGHRDRAIEATDRAINQVEQGIHDAER